MKKKILLLLSCALLLSVTACTSNDSGTSTEDKDEERTAQLQETYDFYAESIDRLEKEMKLDTKKANDVFEILISIGLNEEVSYCFEEDGFYKVWWGLNKVNVYLIDGSVQKIMDEDKQIYPSENKPLNISDEIIWKDDDNMGIVNLKLDGYHTKEVIVANYYTSVVDYLKKLDKNTLKDYEYIQFKGNVVRDNKIECTILGNLSIEYIKTTDSLLPGFIENNMTDTFIPKALQ